ncbi:methionine sulfoxide reductase B [Pseudooceanicola batsensis HTCC2597]|uniref:Methionine sulfoxide reductase B n=1 Tax=Pseudooceanicola batsensis (strain ATCC BAA-863 / DSM 15984 / KCTC 12145 / HTCC2597) TaxID=252305 RepID=A3TWG2_PSEBH|nr:hypothetical protein [Pseudooceanicola batsensis]EAQ03958.1 methionine sulfoxide reductase B [Pseudooceanicola batsensis HTCC2597]
MRFTSKIIGYAALLTTVSAGAAMAQSSVTEDVPESMEDSRGVESGAINSVETFTDEEQATSSVDETLEERADSQTVTEVDSSTSVPASLETSRLAEATDIEGMDSSREMYIWTMNDVDGVEPWSDEDATEMRSAIVANSMVQQKLEAGGYTEDDVVAAYTRADGGLTVIVDDE